MKQERLHCAGGTTAGKAKLDLHNFTTQEPDPAPSLRPQSEFPAPPINGIHDWLMPAAWWCRRNGLSAAEAVRHLWSFNDSLRRPLKPREPEDAVSVAYSATISRSSKTWVAPKPKWPPVDRQARQGVIESASMTLADLWEASPWRCDEGTDAEQYIDELFPGDPLLCVGWSKSRFITAPREELRGRLTEMALIVPSPMSALTGPRKKDGKPSAHTLANTGPRHYLVTEFDPLKWKDLSEEERQQYGGEEDYQWTSANEQAALIWHLREFARNSLALVVHSGGRSLHAYWRCQGVADHLTHRFFNYAVKLGADPITWNRQQFCRIPQGWRDEERRQDVFYFNPENGKATKP